MHRLSFSTFASWVSAFAVSYVKILVAASTYEKRFLHSGDEDFPVRNGLLATPPLLFKLSLNSIISSM